MSVVDPQLGAIVEIPVGRGVVRFSGTTSFAAGKWIGIELNEQNGKNDGTIKGVAYFTCKPNHGVFVRPSQVKIITERELPPVHVRYQPSFPTDNSADILFYCSDLHHLLL
jgi:dynactin 1